MSLVGLDVGTTGCKAIVFDENGGILGRAAREYPILTPRPNWAEQDAEEVWRRAWDALREAVSAARRNASDDRPVALALSVQGEAVIPVDAAGRALRPAILGMDARTEAENTWLKERFGAEALFNRTGMPVHTVNTLPKLLWLQRNAPEVWRSAHRFLLYEDFFLRRLGGEARISHCLASRTQMYDLHAGTWADDLLVDCGIDRRRLAPLAPDEGGIVGTLRPALLEDLGLDLPSPGGDEREGDLLLVSGGHDQACAALGSGVVETGLAMDSTGTAEVVEVAMDSPTLDERLRAGGISVYRHVVPGLYLAMTLNHSGGLLLRWFRDTLSRWQVEQAKASGQDPYDLILAEVPEEPTDLLVLPHFAGKGTPGFDVTSRGAILGLSFSTTHADIAKAILEGLTFELRANTDLLQAAGIPIKELHAVGGGAQSRLWLQLKADICQLLLRVPRVTEAACLGAAMLAGTGVGVYPDLKTAVASTGGTARARYAQSITPRPDQAAAYDAKYALHRQVYPALIKLHRRLARRLPQAQ
jgi:xylulokinase